MSSILPNQTDRTHPTVGAENGEVTFDSNGLIEMTSLAADPVARNSVKDEGSVFDNGFADDDVASAENFFEQ